ncbi:MAG: hypothetical protein AB9903_12035 [Vulcanimicrobiota bacterium]
MFRVNTAHNQKDLFDNSVWLNSKIKKKFQKSWAPLFYELVFCQVSE